MLMLKVRPLQVEVSHSPHRMSSLDRMYSLVLWVGDCEYICLFIVSLHLCHIPTYSPPRIPYLLFRPLNFNLCSNFLKLFFYTSFSSRGVTTGYQSCSTVIIFFLLLNESIYSIKGSKSSCMLDTSMFSGAGTKWL